jgi:hypothetical protein
MPSGRKNEMMVEQHVDFMIQNNPAVLKRHNTSKKSKPDPAEW